MALVDTTKVDTALGKRKIAAEANRRREGSKFDSFATHADAPIA